MTAADPGGTAGLDLLLTPEGRALVDALTPYDPARALALVESARRRWPGRPELVAAAATQARLRTRAAARFPGRPRWWTPEGLEQATRPEVAARHAARFACAGLRQVVDLGCGAGSDALALAEAGLAVLAVDRDPAALWALRATAADRGLPVRTLRADVRTLDLTGEPACFVDPARRRDGTRSRAPESWSPPWSWVRQLPRRVPAVGAKVAPGIDHALLPEDAQVDWVGVGGDLVEAAVWWGPLRQGSARRRAVVLPRSVPAAPRGAALTAPEPAPSHADARDACDGPGRLPGRAGLPEGAILDDGGGVPVPQVGSIGAWLVEPDPAVIRAGLVSVLAEQLGGWLLDPRIAYVQVPGPVPATPFGSCFEVLEEVPFARRALRAWVRARGIGDVVVKKRGVNVVPEELRASLRPTGDGPAATLVLTRTDRGPLALHVRPT